MMIIVAGASGTPIRAPSCQVSELAHVSLQAMHRCRCAALIRETTHKLGAPSAANSSCSVRDPSCTLTDQADVLLHIQSLEVQAPSWPCRALLVDVPGQAQEAKPQHSFQHAHTSCHPPRHDTAGACWRTTQAQEPCFAAQDQQSSSSPGQLPCRGLLVDVTSPGSSSRSEGDARAAAMVSPPGWADQEGLEACASEGAQPRVLSEALAAVKAEPDLHAKDEPGWHSAAAGGSG